MRTTPCPAVFPAWSVPCLRDAGHDGMHHYDDGRGQVLEWGQGLERWAREARERARHE